MPLTFRPVSDKIGIEAVGADLSRPLDDSTFEALHRAWLEGCILLLRDQDLNPAQQKAFSLRLGTLDLHIQKEFLLDEHPEVLVMSNLKKQDGARLGSPDGGRHWHSDLYWKEVPAKASMLYGREVPPEKGETLFIDMYKVYGALPGALKKRIEGRRVLISRVRSWPVDYPHRPPLTAAEKAALPDVTHPLVRTHPETGRHALYLGNQSGTWVDGMPDDAGRALIEELYAFATQERFVYAHQWRAGDVILWDNRCVMHCATPYDQDQHRRLMMRTTIMDGIRPA